MNRINTMIGLNPAVYDAAGKQRIGQGAGVNFSDLLNGSVRDQLTQSIMSSVRVPGGQDATQGIYMPTTVTGAENTIVAVSEPAEMSGVQLMLFMLIMMMQNTDSGGDFAPMIQMISQMISPDSIQPGNGATETQSNAMMSGNVGAGVQRMVDIALSQVGTHEKNRDGTYGSGNFTKYGAWYGMDGQPWCAMFVSWAADKAGVLNDIVPRHASTSRGASAYKEKGLYAPRSSGYVPREGDAIYFSTNGQMKHVGIVVAFDPSTQRVYTVEGNSNNAVRIRHYDINNTRIDGYGVNGGTSFGTIPGNSTSGTGANTM
jgi:hypothetical protein